MENLIRLIPKFKKKPILVIGDIMVDRFVWGKVSRISPEAPVPVVEVTKETEAVGGAGNVANNLSSLGADVRLISVMGEDLTAEHIRESLRARNINFDGIVTDHSRPTSIKTRIIAQHQQVVRVDKEIKGVFSKEVEEKLAQKIAKYLPLSQAVIISDYGKGIVSVKLLKKTITLAKKLGIPVTVDPKIENFMKYKHVTCITPNTAEAVAGMRYVGPQEERDILALGKRMLRKLQSESVLITRGEKGMTLFEPKDKITNIPTRAKEVYDVTGAGDTVIATLTLALAAKATLSHAAEIANFAAGVVVAKLGTATVTPEELESAIRGYKAKE